MVKSNINNLHQLLASTLGDNFQIVDQTIDLLTKPGDHYGSIMLALEVIIKYQYSQERQTLKLAAKLMPVNPILRLAFDISVTFKKECFAYSQTIPTLVNFQKQHNVPSENLFDKLLPKCYGARISLDANKSEVDEDAVILLENLKQQGYKTEDRLIGFDLDAARIIIHDLARFHAIPLALKIINPEAFKKTVLPALVKNKSLEQLSGDIGAAFHDSIMEGAREIEELKPHLQRLQEIVDYGADHPFIDRPPPKESFGTITHSDFWVSNTMLLRDEKGKPVSNKIIDLQFMTYGTPARDLIFFMFTSIINSVLDEYLDELLKLYYDTFIQALEEFNLDTTKYSWTKFMEEMDEIAPTEVYHVLVMLKPICTEKGKVRNSSEDFQITDWSRKDLLGPSHRRKLRDTVISLEKRNWL